MNKTGRPVSPHVTIYSFPITALTSIANRVTGVALSVGALGVASVELVNGGGAAMSLMQDISASSGALVGGAAKFSVAFPLVYHYLGGVRHLAWDSFPDMLNNVDVKTASYALVGGSFVVSAGFAML
jgi:succinate dehydrogenase (ubiquinone) cytochrome b560 subunit